MGVSFLHTNDFHGKLTPERAGRLRELRKSADLFFDSGDAILTGINGEHWRVSKARFPDKYQPAPATPAGEDGAYISLPNRVFAVPMEQGFQVLLADGESRLTGRAGDWLVDYGDGSLGVVSTRVFDQTYEVVG